jgi:hypothetical protein
MEGGPERFTYGMEPENNDFADELNIEQNADIPLNFNFVHVKTDDDSELMMEERNVPLNFKF